LEVKEEEERVLRVGVGTSGKRFKSLCLCCFSVKLLASFHFQVSLAKSKQKPSELFLYATYSSLRRNPFDSDQQRRATKIISDVRNLRDDASSLLFVLFPRSLPPSFGTKVNSFEGSEFITGYVSNSFPFSISDLLFRLNPLIPLIGR